MFKMVLKLLMVSMMFFMFACSEEGTDITPAITDAKIDYKEIPVDTAISESPTIKATGNNLKPNHFDWSITGDSNNLATIDFVTGIITIIDPKTTNGGHIEVTAKFNNSYTGGTLDTALRANITIKIGTTIIKWDGTTIPRNTNKQCF